MVFHLTSITGRSSGELCSMRVTIPLFSGITIVTSYGIFGSVFPTFDVLCASGGSFVQLFSIT